MAYSTTISSSPNSFQLRLIRFKCNKPPSQLFFRTHLRTFNRRIRLSVSSESVAAKKDGNEGGGENKNPENSWMNSDSSDDTSSGWFGTDSNSSQPKRNFGGLVGAGVAGVILATGIAFASLSLGKRNASGPKQQIQMESLTTEKEMLSASDDQNDKVEQVTGGDDTVRPDEGNVQNDHDPENKTGIDKVSSTSSEITDASSESKPDDNMSLDTSVVTNGEYASNDSDPNTNASHQEDLQSRSNPDVVSVPSDSNPSLPEIPESHIDASSSKDSEGNLDTGTPESTIEPEENPVSLAIPALTDANSTNFVTDQQDEISDPRETIDSKLPLEVSSNSDANVKSGDAMEAVTPISDREHLNPIETFQKQGGSNSPLEQHNLNENESSQTIPTSLLADPFANEPDISNELDKSSSYFQLPMPENSFSSAGIPAPSLVSAALQVPPGKVLVPAVVDQVQGQALAALQVLKVIESDVQSTDLCTRREYARWLVSASNLLSRNSVSKVYPAMYIENVTDLAFDDITPEDPDFASIQGLAEAGLISSKLSRSDMLHSLEGEQETLNFFPESPVSRQDLVSWKMALDKRQLPEVDRKMMQQFCGFIDIDKINTDAWPALVADLSAGEQGITTLAFGCTRLFQPDKPVTNAQAAIALATGDAADIVSEELARIEAESMAETAVAAHTALVAQVEKDVNASFEKELALEKEKVETIEKMAEEAKLELEKLRAEREEENNALMRGRAAVESEMEVLSRLRRELEEQLQSLMSNKTEISFERERINKLRQEAESENQAIVQLQYNLEVERKALSMARAWAEEEAKRAREHAKGLEEARDRWKKHGIKVVVDSDLQDDETAGVTWTNTAKESTVDETVNRAETLVDKLKEMAEKIKGTSRVAIEKVILKINSLILRLKEWAVNATSWAREFQSNVTSKASESVQELQLSANGFSMAIKEGATRIAGDCKEGVEKITQKFKTT